MADVEDRGIENYSVERMSGGEIERAIVLSNHPSKSQLQRVKDIPSGDGGSNGVIYREKEGAYIEVNYQDKYPISIEGSSEERRNARKTLEKILETKLISKQH